MKNYIQIWVYHVIQCELIALLTFQCFQSLLVPRMFPVWDFVAIIFVQNLSLTWVVYFQSLVINIYIIKEDIVNVMV